MQHDSLPFRIVVKERSIPMMCLQTPGAFLWSYTLVKRTGWEGWSLWSIYLVTGCLQGVLLAMAVVFELRRQKERKTLLATASDQASDVDGGHVADEDTPLIRD